MPKIVVRISPTGDCFLETIDEKDFKKHLYVEELHPKKVISKHTFRIQYASQTLGLTKDIHYVSHAYMDINPESSCSLPLNPLRQHVLEWMPYLAQYSPSDPMITTANAFRGPIIVTKEIHIPLSGKDRKLENITHQTINSIWNHDSKAKVVDMTQNDLRLILKELKPIYQNTVCSIF